MSARLARWAVFDLAVMLACWALSSVGPWWTFLLVAPLIGGRIHALGVLLHDACHGPGSAVWLEALGGWPIGTTLDAMRAHHLRHHARTNEANDPYLVPRRALGDGRLFAVLLGIFPFWVFRSVVGALSCVAPRLTPLYARLLVSGEDDVAARRDVERVRRVEWPVVVTWLALLVATALEPAFLGRHWWLPLAWAALFNACRFLAEHSSLDGSAGIEATTREHRSPWLAPFVFPHHVGYHRTHHAFPTAAWEALPRLAEENSTRD